MGGGVGVGVGGRRERIGESMEEVGRCSWVWSPRLLGRVCGSIAMISIGRLCLWLG